MWLNNGNYHRLSQKLQVFETAETHVAFDIYDMIYLSTAIGMTPGGSSTVHIYTQTIHRTTQITQKTQITTGKSEKSADCAPSLHFMFRVGNAKQKQ